MGYFAENRICIVEFNVENLFINLDHYVGQDLAQVTEREWQRFSSSVNPNKPLKQVQHLAATVRAMNPDILMLCEVGGIESLHHFSKLFLQDHYKAHLLEGNSDRGIDIGYLTKRGLPFTYDVISHKHRDIDFLYPHERLSQETGYGHLRSARKESHKFSRDVLELRVFEDVDQPPVLIALLVHLKSQLDRTGIDPGGRDRRKAELEKLVKIYQEIDLHFKNQSPILLAGDFNGYAALPEPDVAFEAIYRDTNLKDCLEVAQVIQDVRFTYQQIYNNRVGINRQLDYIFVPPSIANRVNHELTWVFRYLDDNGVTQLIPRTFNEKRLLPSDHYPVILTLNSVTS